MRWAGLAFVLALGGCTDRATTDSEWSCGEAAPTCSTQELSGECVDAVDETPADCGDEAWVCPDGYHFASEVACTWPSTCEGTAPSCTTQELLGECVDAVDEERADCVGETWVCPPGYHASSEVMCEWPSDCAGTPPTCTDQSTSGDCSDAIEEQPAECVVGEYVCPAGYHFLDEIHCEWPTYCDGDAPVCFEAGDCGGATQPATCDLDTWSCAPGFTLDCAWTCDGGGPAPDECWDQGPGECSDTTQPPSCTDGAWQCPPGWDFGGYGDGCEWPP